MFQKKKSITLFAVLITLSFLIGCTGTGGGTPDSTPPTVPNGISITAVSRSDVKVSWKSSTDDRGVKGYKIYRNGAYWKKTNATSMTDTGLPPNTKYCYRVSAYDASGKESAQSTNVCAVL